MLSVQCVNIVLYSGQSRKAAVRSSVRERDRAGGRVSDGSRDVCPCVTHYSSRPSSAPVRGRW